MGIQGVGICLLPFQKVEKDGADLGPSRCITGTGQKG